MSSYRTRSRTSMLEESVQEQTTDLGLQSASRAPHSPTMLSRRGSEEQSRPRRPATDEGQGACRNEDSRSSRTSVRSRRSRKAAQLRLEYEAEAEMIKLKEALLGKRMAMLMAELDAEEEERGHNHSVSSRSRVKQWLEDTSTTTRIQPRVDLAPPPLVEDRMGERHVSEWAVPRGNLVSHVAEDRMGERHVSERAIPRGDLASPPLFEDRIGERHVSERTIPRGDLLSHVAEDRMGERHVSERAIPRGDLASSPLFEDRMGERHVSEREIPRGYLASRVREETMNKRYVSERVISPAPPPSLRQRNEQCFDGNIITCLTEALQNIARPRPMPRQFFELPSFSGRPEEWLLFKRKYDDTTRSGGYTASENITRLQSALQGEAKLAVEDLLISCADPVVIISALERQFGHPTVILKSALDKIRKLNRLSDNSVSELCKFYNIVRNCVSVLKTLGAECYVNNPQVIEEIVSKFTTLQRAQYSEFLMNVDIERNLNLCIVPDLNIVVEFLEKITKAATYITQVESSPKPGVSSAITTIRARPSTRPSLPASRAHPPRLAHRVHVQAEVAQTKNVDAHICYLCNNKSHSLSTCSEFLNMDLSKRWDLVRNKKLCFKCFHKNHSRRFCRSEKCKTCNYGHHSLLHVDKDETVLNISVGTGTLKTLLKVLPVDIITNYSVIKTYALLDDGATVSLIDEKIATGVSGPIKPLAFAMAKGHIIKDNGSRCVNINIRGPNSQIHSVRVRTVKDLALPAQSLSGDIIRAYHHLADLGCEEMRDARPLLLLGQDNWELIVGRDMRKGKSGRPVASLTDLGWVIHGPVDMSRDGPETVNCCIEMHNLIRSQLELESLGIVEQTRKHRDNDRALEILSNTSQYTVDGWEVGLLWRGNQENIPDNYDHAKKRLYGVENRMDKDSTYSDAYCAQVDRLVENRYAHKVTGGSVDSSPVWYLPHFGVTNPNKPQKLRLVFDAAARYKGVCMNDFLLSGPDMLNSLLGILFRFRCKRIGVTADIADMFLRVRIRKEDRGAQLFLWRGKNRDREPDTYMMDSMIFGAASSPTSAIYILNKNADRFIHSHPEAVQAIRRNHYVDDYVHSVENVDEGIKLINDVIHVHQQGNFNIRGWVTSSPQLNHLLSFTTPDKVDMKKLGGGDNERTLGMIWTPAEDRLAFDLSFKRSSAGVISGEVVPTKREFLRLIMSVFDPLGLLTPIIVNSRIIMRDVWKSGIGWDDKITEPDFVRWQTWLELLHSVQELTVPRWYGIVNSEYELHVFGDASEQAYAAVAYLVGKDQNGHPVVALVAGKARVAPMKIISVPRLELQAAVLASRLARTVASEHDISISRRIMWTDSRTVLQWIKSDPRDYKPFVSHRLAEIDKLTNVSEWRWLPSSFNPADEATRTGWSQVSSSWFSGPVFLSRPELEWPGRERPSDAGDGVEDDERRVQRAHVTAEDHRVTRLIDTTRFSTWTRALRVTARVLAFIALSRRRQVERLTSSNIKDAEVVLLKESQRSTFTAEMEKLRKGERLEKGNRISPLDPIEVNGLLRVRGRLTLAPIEYEARHPIILDGRDRTTELIIAAYHDQANHLNNETVVNALREKFHIVRVRPTVKKVVSRCQRCRIERAKPACPKMADLPPARLMVYQRAFSHSGVDLFGPMIVTVGRRHEKRWGVVFTCLTTRAVHLEVAASLNADSTIMALRRLIARRGQPVAMYSDCGTNFVGAVTEMKAAFTSLRDDVTARGIDWHFNPPSAPHMGGSWERLVRSTKVALKATLCERAPRDEVLLTLLAEAENVINSRPLTHVPVDVNDPVALTPNHLLLGSNPENNRMGDFVTVDLRRQWRAVQALADMFWKRWLKEYLPTLQKRAKWTTPEKPMEEGDIVIVADTNLPRNTWPRGIIDKVYPGVDGQVRVVEVRTTKGVLKRPAVKVIVLPTDVCVGEK